MLDISNDHTPFYTAWCTVSSSTHWATAQAKCIRYKQDRLHLQDIFGRLPLNVSRARYLVTRDYAFHPIVHPPTDRTDRLITSALTRQRDYQASLTKTILSGFEHIDPFFHTPATTYTLESSEQKQNTLSMAALILKGPSLSSTNSPCPSPVVRVTTSNDGKKIYLTALKQHASDRVRYTADLIPLLEDWIGKDVQIQCDCTEARNHINSDTSMTAPPQSTYNPQQQRTSSAPEGSSPALLDTTSLATKPPAQSEPTSTMMDPAKQVTASLIDPDTPTTMSAQHTHATPPDALWRNETEALRALIESQSKQIQDLSLKLDDVARTLSVPVETTKDDMLSTISTIVEMTLSPPLRNWHTQTVKPSLRSNRLEWQNSSRRAQNN